MEDRGCVALRSFVPKDPQRSLRKLPGGLRKLPFASKFTDPTPFAEMETRGTACAGNGARPWLAQDRRTPTRIGARAEQSWPAQVERANGSDCIHFTLLRARCKQGAGDGVAKISRKRITFSRRMACSGSGG